MSQEPLHLFNGHTLVNGSGGKGPPEFVRVRLLRGLPAELPQAGFHSANHQAFARFCQRDKQGRVLGFLCGAQDFSGACRFSAEAPRKSLQSSSRISFVNCSCVWGADKKGLFVNIIYEQLLYCSDVSAF
jgi:hypothetical protein